jgi:AcrR family transcriptional regulator
MSSSPAPTPLSSSRAIARAAVRAELSLAAYELVVERGYENVTLDDMATAGGVSRSTFLRHFGAKDQAISVAMQAHGERMALVLRARPVEEGDWEALRQALESFVVPIYLKDPAGALAITRLSWSSPGVFTQNPERLDWRAPLTRALADRHGITEPVPFSLSVKVTVALQCLSLALDHWAALDGAVDLVDLIDEGFATVSGTGVLA